MLAATFAEHVRSLPLVDHHVHGAFTAELERADFEVHLNEGSPERIPEWMTQFDSQLGFAIRRWCAPVIGLEPHASAEDYLAHRARLGAAEVNRRLLGATGVGTFLVDSGYQTGAMLGIAEMADAAGAGAAEVVRLEAVAERVALSGTGADDFATAYAEALDVSTADAVGLKTASHLGLLLIKRLRRAARR